MFRTNYSKSYKWFFTNDTQKDLIYLNVTFEQASKFIVSAGTTNSD